jgi:hypothetical protein
VSALRRMIARVRAVQDAQAIEKLLTITVHGGFADSGDPRRRCGDQVAGDGEDTEVFVRRMQLAAIKDGSETLVFGGLPEMPGKLVFGGFGNVPGELPEGL